MTSVALRWNLPIHEIASWKYQEVLKHFRAMKFESEIARREKEKSDG